MSQARIMDGTSLARRIVEDTAKKAADLTDRTGTTSVTYVRVRWSSGGGEGCRRTATTC